MLGRSPGAAKGSTLQLGARRPTISSPRTPTCQPTRNTRRSSRSPCALRVLSCRVRRMTPKRRKRRGESAPSPEQDKAEVVRAVLTRRAGGGGLIRPQKPAQRVGAGDGDRGGAEGR